MKLRNKFIVLILPLFLIFILSSHFLTSFLLEKELKKSLSQELDLTTEFIHHLIDGLIKDVAVDTEILTSNESLPDLINFRKYQLLEEASLKKTEIKRLFEKVISVRPS